MQAPQVCCTLQISSCELTRWLVSARTNQIICKRRIISQVRIECYWRTRVLSETCLRARAAIGNGRTIKQAHGSESCKKLHGSGRGTGNQFVNVSTGLLSYCDNLPDRRSPQCWFCNFFNRNFLKNYIFVGPYGPLVRYLISRCSVSIYVTYRFLNC